jgi:hypothetical protein
VERCGGRLPGSSEWIHATRVWRSATTDDTRVLLDLLRLMAQACRVGRRCARCFSPLVSPFSSPRAARRGSTSRPVTGAKRRRASDAVSCVTGSGSPSEASAGRPRPPRRRRPRRSFRLSPPIVWPGSTGRASPPTWTAPGRVSTRALRYPGYVRAAGPPGDGHLITGRGGVRRPGASARECQNRRFRSAAFETTLLRPSLKFGPPRADSVRKDPLNRGARDARDRPLLASQGAARDQIRGDAPPDAAGRRPWRCRPGGTASGRGSATLPSGHRAPAGR